tara:strand:+ start:10032 stop:10418 length:387 start_codon:yes stop_codon:yes gene_type:complete
MITFDQASELIQSARNPHKGKPIYGLPHTKVVLIQGSVTNPEILAIRYYNTNIVNIYPNNTYMAKTCSWNTRTTKKRINTLTPMNIKQKKGVWYHNSEPFYSGISVNQDGSVIENNTSLSSVTTVSVD